MPVLTAEEQLRAMVHASGEPALTDDEIATLLALNAVEDGAGIPPPHADWTPAYDLDRAAAMGWEWKAGKLAAEFDFRAEDRSDFRRSQAFEHCKAMARSYRAKVSGSVHMGGSTAVTDPVLGNVNA